MPGRNDELVKVYQVVGVDMGHQQRVNYCAVRTTPQQPLGDTGSDVNEQLHAAALN